MNAAASQPGLHCSICGMESKAILAFSGRDYLISKGQSPEFSVVICEKCKSGHSEPEMSFDQLSGYYPDSYEPYVGSRGLQGKIQKWVYRKDIKLIRRYLHSMRARLFEIGAGGGLFLNAAKSEGFTVDGCEPGTAGIDQARKNYDIKLQQAAAETAQLHGSDIVVMRHVLEHVQDPGKVIDKIHSALHPKGLVFIKVPRFDSWEARFFKQFWLGADLPRHRWHFSNSGLRALFSRAGFSICHMQDEIVPYDIIRSIKNYGQFGPSSFLSLLSRLFVKGPFVLQLALAMVVCQFLRPFNAGRMILIARKTT